MDLFIYFGFILLIGINVMVSTKLRFMQRSATDKLRMYKKIAKNYKLCV